MHPQRTLIEAAYQVVEAIETPQEFRTTRMENGGRSYSFENGGSVSISVDDNDHHTVSIDHDHPSSISAALVHHIKNTPGGPTSISVENPDHNSLLSGSLRSTDLEYTKNKSKSGTVTYNIVPKGGTSLVPPVVTPKRPSYYA